MKMFLSVTQRLNAYTVLKNSVVDDSLNIENYRVESMKNKWQKEQ